MAAAYRLKLDPSPSENGAVAGVELSFQPFGAGTAQAERDSPKPASISFFVTLSKRAIEERGLEKVAIEGSIEGTITLKGAAGTPFFVVDGVPKFPAPPIKSSASGKQVRPRSVELKLRPSHFRMAGGPLRLFLPKDLADGFHYAELNAEVTVGGAVDANRDHNDALDISLLPRQRLCLSLVDQLGVALANQPLELVFGEEIVRLSTNAQGQVEIENPPAASAQVRFPELAALRDTLKSSWKKIAIGGRLRAREDIRVVHLSEPVEPIEVGLGKTTLSVQPSVLLARLRGTFFDPNRCFLLPAGVSSLKDLVGLHEQTDKRELLIVGHTEKAGDEARNRQLSLARAEAVKAYLSDDVAAWLAWYESSKPASARWGQREDKMMAEALIPNHVLTESDDWEYSYREWHNTDAPHPPGWAELPPDGAIDSQARKQLIGDYMALDGTTLADDASVTTHGCGANFPLSEWGDRDDGTPEPDDPLDMRIEFFLFDKNEGILPAPPDSTSKVGSPEYPEWLRRADRELSHILSPGVVQIWLLDHLGRRMGADPKATDEKDRKRGAPYCLIIPPDQTRTGYADSEGMVVERDLIVKAQCVLYWGTPEARDEPDRNEDDDGSASPTAAVDPLSERYQYREEIFLDTTQDGEKPDLGKILHNLGYTGSAEEQQKALQRDYGSSDGALVVEIHESGKPRPGAGG